MTRITITSALLLITLATVGCTLGPKTSAAVPKPAQDQSTEQTREAQATAPSIGDAMSAMVNSR